MKEYNIIRVRIWVVLVRIVAIDIVLEGVVDIEAASE